MINNVLNFLLILFFVFFSEWSQLSIGVLSECYSTHERKAQDLLVRELTHWGEATCMLIAVKADNKEFISQSACQSLLNTIWMGKMMQENGTWRVGRRRDKVCI